MKTHTTNGSQFFFFTFSTILYYVPTKLSPPNDFLRLCFRLFPGNVHLKIYVHICLYNMFDKLFLKAMEYATNKRNCNLSVLNAKLL